MRFTQSAFDECVFYHGKSLYVLYTDDSILTGPDQTELKKIVQDLNTADLDITMQEGAIDFLRVNIDRKTDGTIHLTQPRLIQQILQDLRLDEPSSVTKPTPMVVTKILQCFPMLAPLITTSITVLFLGRWVIWIRVCTPTSHILCINVPDFLLIPRWNMVKPSNILDGISKVL